jgi:hypothetical protein
MFEIKILFLAPTIAPTVVRHSPTLSKLLPPSSSLTSNLHSYFVSNI